MAVIAKSSDIFLELDFGPENGTVKFISIDEVRAFIETEFAAWQWLSQPPVISSVNQPWNIIQNQIANARNYAQRVTDADLTHLQGLSAALDNAFGVHRIPLTVSRVFQFIEELRSESAITAAAAIATWMNLGGVDTSKFAQLKGSVLMVAFDAEITSKTPVAVKRSLEKLKQQFHDSRVATETEVIKHHNNFRSDRLALRKAMARMLRQSRKDLRNFRDRKAVEVAESIKSLDDTQTLYREHMRIKGPVEYWSHKASAHRTSALSYRTKLMVFAAVATIILVGSLYFLASHAIEVANADKPPAVYLILVTLGVVITTIVFWVARIITRLFLSEHHLAIDAEERSVMAQTYLALTAEGLASDKEREIVLASLFRPTADGIVKDDAAPDLSPASLISKLGSR
ncbi:DUF6161 domain-containing protein [Phyllobacterium chamaecytisi]|uniref:DUF6161 domain-containing protein n=1 Tax=Phyllobacterium chamaecytisi TaxID=2876082 RepID=UPI001CCFFB9A|nr:DUF6161 domain-containing protein [Phyllobacterium sp. KW56]MBZ9600493.1 hypothetical protein [Phyllobacterium sp. KW56]